MPDDNDDRDNLLRFERVPKKAPKPKANGHLPPTLANGDPEDIVAAGAIIVALALAVAIVSGWIPLDRYTIGIAACCAAGAVMAKVIKARRRPKAPVTKLPPRRRN
jgi:hypothetical protein